MNTVDTLISLAEQQARNVLLVLRERSLMPTWVIIDKDGQPRIRATPWENDAEKRLAELLIRLEIRSLQARAYSFVTEAWEALAPKDWDPKTPLPEKDRAANRPEREEVVLAFASDGQQRKCCKWVIRRDWNEQIIGLETPVNHAEGTFEGWITEML